MVTARTSGLSRVPLQAGQGVSQYLLNGNYKNATRSTISGYLHKNRALLLYELLKTNENENYIVTLSSIENDVPFEYKFSEFTFKDDKPMYEEYMNNLKLCEENNLFCFDGNENFKKLCHIDSSGFIGDVGNNQNRFESIIRYSKNYEKYMDVSDYVEIAIMDKRWGRFDEIYSVFLNSIRLV